MGPLGVGLIGYGGFGRFILEVLSEMPEVEVVAVADVDEARRQEASWDFGARPYANANELLSAPDLDIIVVSTPPYTHASLSAAAARAGKHVFCEKPLAVTLDGAETSIAAAEQNDVCLTVDYVQRHNPLNRRLRALLQRGVLGPLLHMSLENLATDEPLQPGHWFWDRERSGGIWVEHGVHFFDLFRWLSGERAEAVSAAARTRPDGSQDRVWATVRYSDQLIATYLHAFTQPQRFEQTTIRLSCARGYATLHGWIPTRLEVEGMVDEEGLEWLRSWSEVELQIVDRYTGKSQNGWAFGGPYQVSARVRVNWELREGKEAVYREAVRAGMADFVTAIRDPEHMPEVKPSDGRESLAVALAATRAAEFGTWEPIPE